MLCLSVLIALERCQSSVSRAIRMAEQVCPLGAMKQDRHPDLLENEVPLKVVSRRSQRLCSSSDDDHVRPQNSLPLQKFVHCRPDALVEAAEHRSIGNVGG